MAEECAQQYGVAALFAGSTEDPSFPRFCPGDALLLGPHLFAHPNWDSRRRVQGATSPLPWTERRFDRSARARARCDFSCKVGPSLDLRDPKTGVQETVH